MIVKTFFSIVLVCMLASMCFAQLPANKTNLTLADREAWRRVLGWSDKYEEQWKRSRLHNKSEAVGLAFHELGSGKYLVMITVTESAYQPGYIFMYYDPSRKTPSRPLRIKTYVPDDEGPLKTPVVEEIECLPTFDEQKKQLVIYTKGRGTADCGSLVRYRITPQRAVPLEARTHACFDDYSLGVLDPQKWRKVKRL